MRLKSFTASTMKEALQMIREALGEDAIIVSTQELQGGKSVRVTAAIDKDTEATMPRPLEDDPSQDDWQYMNDDDEATVVEEITEVMLRHAVPDEVLDQVVSMVNIMGLTESRNALFAALQNLFEFKPLPQKTYGKPLMLVGPPGAGKTLAAAKIAARGALTGLRMAVITTDTVRAGGVEQLEAFTRLMKIDLKKTSSPKDLKEKLTEIKGVDQIIIDTAGVNPFDPESVKLLARLIHAADCDPVLVIPAGLDADESGEIGRVFSTIGAKSLLATRVDVARRLGSLLSAAHHGGLSFAEVSNTAKVADGLAPMSAKRLTQMLMPRAEDVSALANVRKAG
ncbi:MAG: GTPase [Micavibrio aeruginosavorus]|uniref:GTPase n=1 Tax=Micavibrio aeruginosavorus TaxID=349221 RepID=A0A2W5PPC9_9BACT|nr:MAG: GTPase [Micavibrio aeruginosavorus]